jgi:hypothetical protein
MKIRYIVLLGVISALLLTATQVLASPAVSVDYKRTPSPKGPEGHGNPGGNGQGGNPMNGNNDQGQNGDHGNRNKNNSGQNLPPGKPALVHRVGTVVAYLAGESITIQDRSGNQFTFILTAGTKILPNSRVASLGVGSYVTIIAPRKPHSGSAAFTATGIVIHPQAPTSFPTATLTPTSTPTSTPTETPTSTPEAPIP